MRAFAHPSQQVQASRVLPPMEVRERAPLLRKVRVRARHGENASDAEDPSGTPKLRRHTTANPRPQTRQCLIPFPLPLAVSFFPICIVCAFFFLSISRHVADRPLGLVDSRFLIVPRCPIHVLVPIRLLIRIIRATAQFAPLLWN